MPVQFDERAKRKPYIGYFWNPKTKKKVSCGAFETEEAAEEAVRLKMAELKIPMPLPASTETKKPVNLKFGLWK